MRICAGLIALALSFPSLAAGTLNLPQNGGVVGQGIRTSAGLTNDKVSESIVWLSDDDEWAVRTAVSHLVLMQGRILSPGWDKAQRDCAGLVRFAYREALKPRTLDQRKMHRLPAGLPFPEVSSAARQIFPSWPALWQITKSGKIGFFADGEALIAYNFRLKSFEVEDAKPGDLLVYHTDDEYGMFGRHIMIFAGGAGPGFVVYHNGATDAKAAVQIVSAASLASEPAWQPSPSNPHFRGVYEWQRFRKSEKF